MSGYFDDITWHLNSHVPAQNLTVAQFRFTLAGYDFPNVETVCELGFGNGVAINVAASTRPDVDWYGTDFNPQHFENAERLQQSVGNDAKLIDTDFADFLKIQTPGFDLISLIGCWSWIPEQSLLSVLDILEKKLNPGGVFLFNYITNPGQAHFAAFRQFVLDCAEIDKMSGKNNLDRVSEALSFVNDVVSHNPWYLRANPDVADFLRSRLDEAPEFFLHEYLNANWQPMSFSEVAQRLEPRGLQFVCDSEFLEHMEELHIDARQRKFLEDIEDETRRETSKDFIRLRASRCDYWAKNPRRLSKNERARRLSRTRFALARPADAFDAEISGTLGPVVFEEKLCQAALQKLACHGQLSMGEMARRESGLRVDIEQLIPVFAALTNGNYVVPVSQQTPNSRDEGSIVSKYNRMILHDPTNAEVTVMASGVAGGGINVSPIDKAFLKEWSNGPSTADLLAQKLAGSKLPGRTEELKLSVVSKEAHEFVRHRLPVFESLGII